MKTNQKKLTLIKYGFKPATVINLNESQINVLYSRLMNEQSSGMTMVPKTDSAKIQDLKNKKQTFQVYEKEVKEDDTEVDVANASKGMYTQDKLQEPSPDGTDDERGSLEEELKNIMEKFESKKQQRYFYAKCGDGKTKEQKKWCKMADEFSEKTNYKKLPDTKKETNEIGMSNYVKKVASAYAGGLKNKLNTMGESTKFAENKLEKQIMRLVEKHVTPKMSKKEFLNLVREASPAIAPSKPDVKPDVDTPTKPSKPATPYQPKPGVKPAPKAGKEAPVKPDIDIDTPTKPSKPATPYQPKPGVKPAPKAGRKSLPTWLSFDEIGINIK